MSTNYGIKVTKAGVSTTTTDIRDLLMSSKYSMLKYHSDNSGTVTFTPGDTNKTVSFSHSLGYVPAFIAYGQDFNGALHYIPSLRYPADFTSHAYAYATSTQITCGYVFDSGAYNKPTLTASDYWDEHFGDNLHIVVGKKDGNVRNGALRFSAITIPQGSSISSASLNYQVEFKGADSSHLKIITYGIAEDNTASFSSSPMSRTKTSASHGNDLTIPATGASFSIDVTSIVQEIVNRGGWVSGNAMGFIIQDDLSNIPNTLDGVWAEDDKGTGSDSTLTITYGSNTSLVFRTIIFKDKLTN